VDGEDGDLIWRVLRPRTVCWGSRVVEGCFDPVGVVSVQIHVEDPPKLGVEQLDSQNCVVAKAKARCAVDMRVVSAALEVDGDIGSAGQEGVRGSESGAGDGSCGRKQSRKRLTVALEAEAALEARWEAGGGRRRVSASGGCRNGQGRAVGSECEGPEIVSSVGREHVGGGHQQRWNEGNGVAKDGKRVHIAAQESVDHGSAGPEARMRRNGSKVSTRRSNSY
jgi:hypothetical protein